MFGAEVVNQSFTEGLLLEPKMRARAKRDLSARCRELT